MIWIQISNFGEKMQASHMISCFEANGFIFNCDILISNKSIYILYIIFGPFYREFVSLLLQRLNFACDRLTEKDWFLWKYT